MFSKLLSVLTLVLMSFGTTAWSKNVTVTVGGQSGGGYYGPTPDLTFVPANLTINAGDTVTFVNAGGTHNVDSDTGLFRCANGCDGDGKGGNGNPATGWSVTIPFNTAGTFGYHCDMHQSMGMVGSVTVQGAAATPDFSLAAQSGSLSVAQGATATDVISMTPVNGFTSSVKFAASGLPSGVTASFGSASSIGSTLTLTVDSTATAGTSTVKVTGTSGSLTHSVSVSLTVTAVAPTFSITPGISGLWYNAAESGQGFDVQVIGGNNIIAVWYVFDANGNNFWLTAQGTYTGNTATLDVTQTSGGDFPPNFDQTKITHTPWGTFNLTFTDCNTGTAEWTPTVSGFTAGSLSITRLTGIGSLACP